MNSRSRATSPMFGVGVRRAHLSAWEQAAHSGLQQTRLDFVEIVSENFMYTRGRAHDVLMSVAAQLPVLPHGVSLSIGGIDPLDTAYLDALAKLADSINAPFISDHLCISGAHAVQYHELLPVPFSPQAVDHICARIEAVENRTGFKLALENPSYYAHMPQSTLSELEFIQQVLAQSGCGLLLDVNNVYVNACNHGYDPRAFVQALPAEKIWQIHVAGHDDTGPVLIDTHSGDVCQEVWSLYRLAFARCAHPVYSLFEWDNNLADLPALLARCELMRQTVRSVHAGCAA